MRRRIFTALNRSWKEDTNHGYVDVFIISLILLNVLAIVLESVEPIRVRFESLFYYFEIFSIVVFTIEYILRVWTANYIPRFQKPVTGNLKYAVTPLAIVDLLAIIPFYLPFLQIDFRLFRILRLVRLFRLLKMVRYVNALAVIGRVFARKKEQLVITSVFAAFVLLIFSSLIYFLEHQVQPDKFTSIPATLWWGITTITTVGYGDVYPITEAGKLIGGLFTVLSIVVIALPTGILASGFSKEFSDEDTGTTQCPACGHKMQPDLEE